ncbi:MAG: hypothetical protein WKG52_11775 [Variovorax sp.]
MATRRSLLLGAGALAFAPSLVFAKAGAPPLMLAAVYRRGVPLDDYWISEKYDGVRGYWDGQQLWTRGGERVIAPAWFTAPLPAVPLDGELWAGRDRFALAVSTVRSQTPSDAAWREMRFMVFDLPAQPGDFTACLAELRRSFHCPRHRGSCPSRRCAQPPIRRCNPCSTRRCD